MTPEGIGIVVAAAILPVVNGLLQWQRDRDRGRAAEERHVVVGNQLGEIREQTNGANTKLQQLVLDQARDNATQSREIGRLQSEIQALERDINSLRTERRRTDPPASREVN